MNKYAKVVLATAASYLIVLPVQAEEKVWYCETTYYAQIDSTSIDKREAARFKFKVSPAEIIFGSDPPFNESRWPMKNFRSVDDFYAGGWAGTVRLTDGNFAYTMNFNHGIVAMLAECDDF